MNNCSYNNGAVSTKTPKETSSCIIVIFGVTGDLARKKIIPALYKLFTMGLLNEKTRIVGIGRRKYSNMEYSEYINSALEKLTAAPDGSPTGDFLKINSYHEADFTDSAEYPGIREYLKKLAARYKICDFLYYLSTPPANFEQIITSIHASGLSRPDFLDVSCAGSFVRVVIEKPYGYDISSARALNEKVLSIFSEDQIYRIDHYLGKETVQNIMIFRFVNGIFEPIWNQKYIDNVQIKVFESEGIGGRANYFDRSGIIGI